MQIDRWGRGQRKIVVHYHLYKNAGTSVDAFLEQAFPLKWASFDSGPTDVLQASDLAAYLKPRPSVLALSSHVLRPAAPDGFNVFPIALIRHPLDRAYSVYSHVKLDTSGSETAEVARMSDFPGFVRWCLDHPDRGGMVILNYQVIHFSTASFSQAHIFQASASRKNLQESKELISSLPCIGVVDQFDDYFARLKVILGNWLGRVIEGQPARANVTVSGLKGGLRERVAQAESKLGYVLGSEFREGNRLDYELYEHAALKAK